MIWRPDRTIINPFDPQWRRQQQHLVAPRDYGLIRLDASGRRVLNASGQRATDCAPLKWMQAKLCSDSSDVDFWVSYNDTTSPPKVVVFGFEGTGHTLPCYLLKSGVKYFLASTNNISTTHGTLVSGYSVTTTCANCLPCYAGNATSFLVAISGMVQPCIVDGSLGYKVVGDLNGSYTLTQYATCAFEYAIPRSKAKWVEYADTTCTTQYIVDDIGSVNLTFNAAGGAYSYCAVYCPGFYAQTDVPWDCVSGSITLQNSYTSWNGDNRQPAYGGQAVVTPL